MVWANPIVLGIGALLLAIPIVLHFLMRPKPKVLQFPALKFVRQRELSNRTRMRLRHVLLLLLRCLLILLLAAALAGPAVASREFGQWVILAAVWIMAAILAFAVFASIYMTQQRNILLIGILTALLVVNVLTGGYFAVKLAGSDSAQLLGDSQAPVAALIVVDTSPRMSYQVRDESHLDKAKEMGAWLVGQLPSDSQVSVLATDGDQPFFSVDVGAAKNRLETLSENYVSTFIPETLNRGLTLLKDSDLERKEVYIISDLTSRSWTGAESSTVAQQLADTPGISAFVIDVGTEDPQNLSLGTLELNGQTLTTLSPIEIRTSVTRNGDAVQRTVRLRLEKPDPEGIRPVLRDGRVLTPEDYWERTETVNVADDGQSTFQFKYPGPLPLGLHHGTIEIVGQDSLAVDNTRYFTIDVRPPWEVLVVHPTGVDPRNLTDLLAPSLAVERGEPVLFNVTTVLQSNISEQELSQYQAVFVLDPGPIGEGTWKDFEAFVEQGGGLAIFLGRNAASGNGPDRSFLSDTARRILTGEVVRRWDRPIQNPLFISMDDLSHPILEPFRERQEDIRWSNHPIFRFWEIETDELDETLPTRTILRYSTGLPALIERNLGSGRVLIMTTPITEPAQLPRSEDSSELGGLGRRSRVWNYLFVGYCYPTWKLMSELGDYLVQDRSIKLNLSVGQPAVLRNDLRSWPDSYRVFTPRTDQTPTKVVPVDGILRYRFTDDPGQYRLKGQRGGTVLRGFSANLPASDTVLDRINTDGIDQVLGADQYQLARQKNEIQRQQGTSRRGQEFYPLLLVLLVVVLAVEQLMSNRFYTD